MISMSEWRVKAVYIHLREVLEGARSFCEQSLHNQLITAW